MVGKILSTSRRYVVFVHHYQNTASSLIREILFG